ncbi:hypothetical protein ACH3XW_9580 [Acanthocheilonema viteae]
MKRGNTSHQKRDVKREEGPAFALAKTPSVFIPSLITAASSLVVGNSLLSSHFVATRSRASSMTVFCSCSWKRD